MPVDTKKEIMQAAIELFAQKGYLGTSMQDIAEKVGFSKAALYKHYKGKQQILESILQKMETMDAENAARYAMPEETPNITTEQSYASTSMHAVRAFSLAQFRYWTEEPFPALFRRMITLEQYRSAQMMQLYKNYLSIGPLDYMAAIFRHIVNSDAEAMQLALDFYGPMFLLYSAYDAAENKDIVFSLLEKHFDDFFARITAARINNK